METFAAADREVDFTIAELLLVQRYGNNEANIDPKKMSLTRDKSYTVNFTEITLLMGDTIGIRLTATEATKAALAEAKIYLGSVDLVAAGLCVVDVEAGTVDLYVNARKLNTVLDIVVEDANGTVCLTMSDTVKHIASQLVAKDGTNLKAQATYDLIQAIQMLIASQA